MRGERLILGGIVALGVVVYSWLSFIRLANFMASAYDLVIFDQAVRSYSEFKLPIAVVKGVHNGFGPEFSVLGDHWSPILATLAPLYWIHDGPQTLLLAQAVLLASAAIPLWVFTKRALGVVPAHLVALAYVISWPVVEAVAFDFHEAAFVPLLTAVMLERWQAGRRLPVVLAAVALLCVKEDMGLLLAGFGVFLLTQRGWRVMGGSFVAGGLAFTWFASQVLIPHFGGRSDYYWAYGALGKNPSEVVHTALTDPLAVVAQLGTPPVKLLTLALLLALTLGAALFSPLVLMAVPLLAERMLASAFANWWVPDFHYNAFIVIVLFAAGVDGVRRRCFPARRWAIGVLVFALGCVPFFFMARLYNTTSYQLDARERAAGEAVARVPDGVTVEAANNLAPALTSRDTVLLWDRTPRWAPWVVADVGHETFPFTGVAEQRARISLLLANGYTTVFSREGYLVLHKPPTP